MVGVTYKNQLYYISKLEDFRDVMEESVYDGLVEALNSNYGKVDNLIEKYEELEDEYNNLLIEKEELEDCREDLENLSVDYDNLEDDFDELKGKYDKLRNKLNEIVDGENNKENISNEIISELENILCEFSDF